MLRTEDNDEVGMSTEDFAEYRVKIGVEPFEYKKKTVVGFADDPFRNFGTKGDKRFIIDAMMAKIGPAWDDFVEAVNGGSIFSIVTARGHSPLALRRAIENMIETNFKGISKKELVKNLRKFRKFAGEEDMKDKELINAYMDMNKYYPVTFGEGSAQNPEVGKVKALKEFQEYVKYLASRLKKPIMFKDDISNNFIPKIEFSDDDLFGGKKIIQKGEPDFGVIKLRKDEILKLYSNIYKAKTKISWTPRVKFVKGLKKTINFYKKKLLI
jgi:hypothetical protein